MHGIKSATRELRWRKRKRKATVVTVEDINKTIVHSNPKMPANALVKTLKATHGVARGEPSADRLKSAVFIANKAQIAEEYTVLESFLEQR